MTYDLPSLYFDQSMVLFINALLWSKPPIDSVCSWLFLLQSCCYCTVGMVYMTGWCYSL